MITQQAIKWLIGERDNNICGLKYVERRKALNMAIQSLEQMKEGHWISEGYYADGSNIQAFRCSECGNHILEYDTGAYNFCPNCGARMGANK